MKHLAYRISNFRERQLHIIIRGLLLKGGVALVSPIRKKLPERRCQDRRRDRFVEDADTIRSGGDEFSIDGDVGAGVSGLRRRSKTQIKGSKDIINPKYGMARKHT